MRLTAVTLCLLTLWTLAFAPAPFPRSGKPPATEVVVEVVGALERIELSIGARKASVEPGRGWQERLADRLRLAREGNPALYLLVLRCDVEVLSPSDYIALRRICIRAGFPKVRAEY